MAIGNQDFESKHLLYFLAQFPLHPGQALLLRQSFSMCIFRWSMQSEYISTPKWSLLTIFTGLQTQRKRYKWADGCRMSFYTYAYIILVYVTIILERGVFDW